MRDEGLGDGETWGGAEGMVVFARRQEVKLALSDVEGWQSPGVRD